MSARVGGVTKYHPVFRWTAGVDDFVRFVVKERPILNVCSGQSAWGDVTLDKYEPADVAGEWTALPFEADSFGAVFADPPWNVGYKAEVRDYMREALRVAPVAYLMAPWLYGATWAPVTHVWYRWTAGVNSPVLISRYERSRQLPLPL